MKFITLNSKTISVNVIKPDFFPDYENAVLKINTDTQLEMVCPILFFSYDDQLLIRPLSREPNDLWWKKIFPRNLEHNEAVVIIAKYSIKEIILG